MTLMMTKVTEPAKATVAQHGDELDDELLRVALDEARGAADGRDGEDADGDGAPHAADAVHREDVERVVDGPALTQQRRAEAERRPPRGR